MRRTTLLALILALLSVGSARAHSIIYEDGSGPVYEFTLPKGWNVRVDGARVVAAPADVSMWFGTWELTKHDEQAPALEDAEDYLEAYFADLKIQPGQATTLNGMSARRLNGTGTYNGNPVRFSVLLFEPRPQAMCVAIGVWDDHEAATAGPVEATLGSLRPVRGQ